MKKIVATMLIYGASTLMASDFWYASHPSICQSDTEPGYKICLKANDVILTFFGSSKMDAELECLRVALSLGLKDECRSTHW